MISHCGAVKGSLKTVATADVNAVFLVFEVSVVGGNTQIKCFFCFGHLNAVSFFALGIWNICLNVLMLFLSLDIV